MLCSGSRDHMILGWDHREASRPIKRFQGHSQEVCGLRWSHDGQYLASGGNDNKVRLTVLHVHTYKFIYGIIFKQQ